MCGGESEKGHIDFVYYEFIDNNMIKFSLKKNWISVHKFKKIEKIQTTKSKRCHVVLQK